MIQNLAFFALTCRFVLIATSLLILVIGTPLQAQETPTELAATLEVLAPGVEVLRVNTVNWISVQVEAIVGVGDTIRTDTGGQARITFFSDGVDTLLLPGTEYRIEQFESATDEQFNIEILLLLGQTSQRVERLLDIGSTYDVNMPGMNLTVRGTAFDLRVESSGRSALLVTDSAVQAVSESLMTDVAAGFGVRSDVDGPLSDVIPATSFSQLDAGLDGCAVTIQVSDDVRLNVRLGPGRDFARVGTVDPAETNRFFGVSESGTWYRIAFSGGLGWVLASSIALDPNCAGLRVFPNDRIEDATALDTLGETIDLEDVLQAAADSPTPENTD